MAAKELERKWAIEDRDEARSYSRMALKHLVEDADAAGFSPMAVLGSGSAPPYNAAAGFAPLSRQAPVRQAVGGSPLGSAIGAATDAFLQTYDPYENHRKSESAKIISSAVATKNVAALSRVPQGRASIARGSYADTSNSGALSAVAKPTKGEVKVTNPWETMEVDPNARDAAAYEERYGELLSNVGGVITLGRDWAHNVGKKVGPIIQKARSYTTKPAADFIIRNGQRWELPKLSAAARAGATIGRMVTPMTGGGGAW